MTPHSLCSVSMPGEKGRSGDCTPNRPDHDPTLTVLGVDAGEKGEVEAVGSLGQGQHIVLRQ